MKKLALLSLFVLSSIVVFGQKKLSFGVKAGLNVTNISTQFAIVKDGQKSTTNLNGGIFLDAKISDNFAIQPQLMYNGKGLFFNAGDHSHTIKIQSIDLPIYTTYKFSKGLFIGAGPNFGYNMSGKNITEHGNEKHTTKYPFEGGQFDYKRFDFGASAIVGYEHKSGFLISANYLKGINNVGIIADNDWKSNVLAFSVGYKFK